LSHQSIPPELFDILLHASEPIIRYKALALFDPGHPGLPGAQQAIKSSPRVIRLLAERLPDGSIPRHPYEKWRGAHWVLVMLAESDYPPGDETLLPLRDQVLAWLLGPAHQKTIRLIAGRVRRCASQEGNALFALLKLGLFDDRLAELARRLVSWQWPDGGWNCDKHPQATHSSFWESLIPLRALSLYARMTGDTSAQLAAEQAAEIFMQRRLFKRLTTGEIMHPDFVKLHYPCYWHYDILFALKVMAEAGLLDDPRCHPALELLETKRLPGGGFPAAAKYYRVTSGPGTGISAVDWSGVSSRQLNEFVTLDALKVLSLAASQAHEDSVPPNPAKPVRKNLLECDICRDLADVETSFSKYGWPEMDYSLASAASRLERVHEVNQVDPDRAHIRRCPVCGLYYDYKYSYEYFVNGSEDTETLTRLAPAQARRFFSEEEYSVLMESLRLELTHPAPRVRAYAVQSWVAHNLACGEPHRIIQFLTSPDEQVIITALVHLYRRLDAWEELPGLEVLEPVLSTLLKSGNEQLAWAAKFTLEGIRRPA
jgi:hypothetical protein